MYIETKVGKATGTVDNDPELDLRSDCGDDEIADGCRSGEEQVVDDLCDDGDEDFVSNENKELR